MALPLYLAQTPLEMEENSPPRHPAWMACHFSPGGRGLSNLPERLPAGAMLILDDSTPMDGHAPDLILEQLSQRMAILDCESLLLDFQRPGVPGQQELVKLLSCSLPCPVGVSALYGAEPACPVLLPPLPPDMPLTQYTVPWKGREIWLEAALEGVSLTLTEAGCTVAPFFGFPPEGTQDEKLHCRYSIEVTANSAIFRLWRTRTDLDALLGEAETLGVTRAIGLWQELG